MGEVKMPEIVEIIENKPLGADYQRLVVASETLTKASPGQFAHLLVQSAQEPNTWDPLLRRPLSIYDVEGEKASFLYRTVGKGTKLLANRKVGEKIDLLGPLGRGFQITHSPALLVGGGVGAAPMLFLARRLQQLGQEFVVLLGAKTREELAFAGDFAKFTSQVNLVTDDGTLGRCGLVTDVVPELVARFKAVPKLYACGPTPMLACLAKIAENQHLALDVSLEARMACGIGACLACTCFLKDGTTARVCADGPVFPSEVLDWGDARG